MTYTIKYKRRFGWTKLEGCISHKYDEKQDKLWVLFDKDKGGIEIKNWSKCVIKLGEDWTTYIKELQKQQIEESAAQNRKG